MKCVLSICLLFTYVFLCDDQRYLQKINFFPLIPQIFAEVYWITFYSLDEHIFKSVLTSNELYNY